MSLIGNIKKKIEELSKLTDYRFKKFGYNSTNEVIAPRGGYISKGLKDANGTVINGTEYLFWTSSLNIPRGFEEQAIDNFHKYVPYPSQKEDVYQGINNSTVKSELIAAVKERLFQINSHLALISYAATNKQIAANTPDILDASIRVGFNIILAVMPIPSPIKQITSLYLGINDAKEKVQLMQDLNNMKLDVSNLSNEAKKLSEKLSKNGVTAEDLDLSTVAGTAARSANISTNQILGLAALSIGGVLLYKKLKNRKKSKK